VTPALSLLVAAGTSALPGFDAAPAADFPSLEQVQAWAADAAGRGPPDSALARARWRAALPHLTVRFGSDVDLDIRSANTRTVVEGQALTFDAWARWRLPDLVFHPDELRVLREARSGQAVRTAARVRVTELYFERLRVRQARRRRDDASLRLEAARLDGLLDAVTAGAYRRWRRGGAP
jgi:hypothetical protein